MKILGAVVVPIVHFYGRKELGLEIHMDGTFALIVDKKARQ